ncbi:hypothetical protein DB32_001134 [Sandaracinus amylolyticus]|uniref:Uncharacterized protein n=1 Tax=Sandaracinus amylolyticus TaxID=927083 RepID=A0A0F6YFT0_9BACT|nr:hypothetical protein DB32_001134 [Sandaracinus amylolyticus]
MLSHGTQLSLSTGMLEGRAWQSRHAKWVCSDEDGLRRSLAPVDALSGLRRTTSTDAPDFAFVVAGRRRAPRVPATFRASQTKSDVIARARVVSR